MKHFVFLWFFLVFALILGCGSDGRSGVSVSLYFTDFPGDEFPSVEVNFFDVNVCSDHDCQNRVNLFHSDTGLTVDLVKLKGILQYIDQSNIPGGTYNRLEVVIESKGTVTENNGDAHPSYFEPDTPNPNKTNLVLCPSAIPNRCLIRFNGAVQPFSMGKFIVDFELKHFEVEKNPCPEISDPDSWCITEVKMNPLGPQDKTDEFEFSLIARVVDTSSRNVKLEAKSRPYTIELTEATLCNLDLELLIEEPNCLYIIAPGECVKVRTPDDPAIKSTLIAEEVEYEKDSNCS